MTPISALAARDSCPKLVAAKPLGRDQSAPGVSPLLAFRSPLRPHTAHSLSSIEAIQIKQTHHLDDI